VIALAACGAGSTNSATKAKRQGTVTSTSTTTTTPPAPISYQVKRGDTLTSLARFFGLSLPELASVNHLSPDAQLSVGQTIEIPPRPPVQLQITPPEAAQGAPFTLVLTGAHPGETVTFEIDAPGGGKFTGPPHTTAVDGSLTTMYQTAVADNPGTYTVVATGNQGTSFRATFRLDATPTS